MVKGKKQKHKLSAAVVGQDKHRRLPRLSKKTILISGILLLLVIGGGTASYFFVKNRNKSDTTVKNITDSSYFKNGFNQGNPKNQSSHPPEGVKAEGLPKP